MFTYIINEERVTFNSLEEAIPALEKAESLGYKIEEVTGEKKKPKKKEEKDPILENIEANTPKEDFIQGPVERADALAQTAAPDDPELLLATSSSVSREQDLPKPKPEPDPIFAPEPKFITDPIDIGNTQSEIDQIEISLQDFGFNQSEQGKEALKRQQFLQSKLDETVSERMFEIQQLPPEERKTRLPELSYDQQKVFYAAEQLRKDTKAYSGFEGKGLTGQFIGLAKDLIRAEEEPTEVIEYDQAVYTEVISALTGKDTDTGRLVYDAMTLDQKENILKQARFGAYEKTSLKNKNTAQDLIADFNATNLLAQDQADVIKAEIKAIKGDTPNDALTKQQVDSINVLIDKLNGLAGNQQAEGKRLTKQFEELEGSQEALAGAYKIDLASQTIGNVFKKSDEIQKFKDDSSAGLGGFQQGLNSILQGSYQIVAQRYLGLPILLMGTVGSLAQNGVDGDFDYNIYDAFIDTMDNNINYDVLGTKPSNIKIGKSASPQEIFAQFGEMLPFTANLIIEAKKGKVSSLEKAVGRITGKSRGPQNLLSGANKDLITAQATVQSLALSNYTEALDQGLDKGEAFNYSSQLTLATMMVQMVMPDYKLVEGSTGFKSTIQKIIKNEGNITAIAIAESMLAAGKNFGGTLAKEVGEEELELAGQRLVNGSFALANSNFFSDEWYTEQKQLLTGVLTLSGSLGTVGTYKTAVNTYSQVLKSTDAQIEMLGFQLQTELAAIKKLPEIKQQDPIVQEKIKQLESGLSYVNQLKTAKTMAPSNVTGVELGYLVEKVRLIEENKKLDPAFRADNNEEIEKLDKLIAESRTVKFIKDAAEKDVKVAENIRKSLNLGAEIEAYDTQEEVDARVQALENRASNEPVDTSAYGAIIPMKDGSDVIIINKSAAIRDGRINTAAHELLHRYLKNTFKTEGDTVAAGKALDAYYESLGLDSDGEFEARRKSYAKEYGVGSSVYNEEIITLLSEAMLDNKVKSNQGTISKLVEGITDLLGIGANKEITLDDGKSVFNFVKEYNKSIKKGKATKKIAKGAAGIKGALIKGEGKAITPTTNKSMQIEALEQAYFDLQDQAAEDPNNLALYERMEKAGDALDVALAAPASETVAATEAAQDAPKEVIVRPKADKSKRKYSLDKDVKKEIEPKIAEAQKVNKDLIAQEKKLNADAIAEIEAIDDKVESRTSREKRIADLKNKPLTVEKPSALNKIEREITAALETPINKAVNLFTKLYYDKIAKNATAAVTREEFMQSAKAEITSLTINEFKPETINRSGEEVINDIEDIIFQRGGLRLRNLAQRLGVVGKDQGISRGADALTKIADTSTEMSSDAAIESITEQSLRKVSALLASDTRTEQAKQQVKEFWIENEGNTKVENFKKLPNLINNILSEMFGVTQGTLTARSGNLNKQDYANAVEAFTKQQAVFTIKEGDTTREARVSLDEVGAFQDGLNEQRTSNPGFSYKREANESIAEALFRFLPQTSAGDYKYASGRKGRFSGKSTGLPKNLMNLAYKVESRKTTGIGNVERTEQKLTMEEVLEAIGARKNEDGTIVKKSEVSGRDKEGQTLLGLINLFGRMTTNELSRTEGDLDPMTVMDLEMGKNPNMYSRALTKNFFIPGNNELVKGLNEKLETRFGVNWQDREVANLADVVDFIYKDLRKINLNTARAFTYEYVEQLRKSDDVTEGELSETVGRAVGKAYGTAYKNILEKVGMNKIWNSLSKKSLNKLSDEAKVERIESFLKVYARTFTNEKFLGMTNNADLFNELAKATGLGKKGLNKLGFTLSAEPGINPKTKKEQTNIFIQLNEKPIKKVTGTDYIKKQIATGNTNKVNAAGVTLEKDAKDAHDLILSEIDPLIESGDLSGASEKLAIMRLGTNALVRKVSLLGKFIKLSPKDTEFILEHETAAVFIYDAYQQYINDKGTTTAKNKLEKFLKGAYVNVISKELDDALPRVGGVERMNTKEVKKLINKKGTLVIDYAAQRKELATKNSLKLPKNLRIDGLSVEESIKQVENFDKAITLGNSLDQPTKGISVWDFDDTLATTKSNVLFTMPDGTKGKLDASRFAKEGDAMLANGAKFDFSEFSKVMNGAKGPFFNKAVDRNRKFGNKDVYVLTARPANSANAIHEFLKGIGLDIPLANITGLASSDPQAKANWVVGKFAEGYNDFYFADDHVGNVNAVSTALSALDNVRSNVELAKAAKYSKKIRREYSAILLKTRGDLVVGNVLSSPEGQIDAVFDWAKTLDIPEKNKGKYKRAALNFIAKSDTNFPMDIEIVDQAMRIVEAKKLDAMSFTNPRDIIEDFADGVKERRLDPNKEKQFFNKKSLPEGVETFQIMPTRRGQQAVRKMLDTHWGKKTNPWCVTVQKNDYTPAEQKERKENPPGIPPGTEIQIAYEAIINAGVVESYITFDNLGNRVEDVMFDFIGNLKPGWVAGKADYDSTNPDDQLIIDRDNEQDFNEELDKAKAEGYTIREGSYDTSQDNFYVQMERNNDPEVNKVQKYVSYYKTKDPNMTQKEFDNGPAKGGAVKNPEINPTGPIKLTPGSFRMWKNYGKPLFTENVNEDTGAVEIDDGGFEIAFKDGKLLALKNLGGSKQEWFDRMDKGTKDLALKVPRNAQGKIDGKSTMMNTDSGRVFSRDYTTKYSMKIEPTLDNLINELSIKGDAVNSSTTNLRAQPKEVKEVINTLDIKSDTQQARVRYSMDLNKRFNEIIEEKSGIESFKEYQSVKSGKKGAKKGKLSFFIPPSAEDFMGLLYKTLPKGKKGESAMAFYKEHVIDPYWKGVSGLRTQRISIAKQYRALKKELGIVPRKLKKTFKYEDENGNMKESLFTKEEAIRVYAWDAQGLDIEGLSNVDLPILVNYVNSQPDLKAFADKLLELNKNNPPKAPTKGWTSGTITSDLLNTLNTEGRKKMLEVWQQNVDAIFTETNLNKLEAAFGQRYVEALTSSLGAMSTGQNSKPTGNRVTDGFVRWLNAAVGNIMFLNRRSAVLQLISFTNFINFEGNNLYQAAKAFANQPQYWKDWTMLMNSDYLVDRRDGLKINVNEADIATTAKENGFQGVLAKVLQAGFIPTKMADSVAIATGGASFYRNRVNTYLNEKTINGTGYTLEQAEKQAMQDFIKTAETSQQSSDPAMTSKQQREPVGRLILAFANTPSQYARIIKRSTQDLVAGRGDAKTHLSRIAYYGFLQNAIFNFLQQGLFSAMMGDDDEEEVEELTEKQEESRNKKMFKVANSMTDGILRGIGVGGAVVSAVKNLAIKYYERSQKTRNQRLAETLVNGVVAVSPPVGSKLSKVTKVGNTMEWGKKEIEFDEMSLKHPYVTAASSAIAAATGLPTDRAVGMAIDAVDIASSETETWMKPLIALGWPKWQLMSEEATLKEREEKKERFKKLEADKEFEELNPTDQRRSVLKKLSKKEQEEILWNSGVLTRKQIRNLKTEANRVDKIMALRDKKQFEKDMESLSQGGDILPTPKVKRPVTKRKDSLK